MSTQLSPIVSELFDRIHHYVPEAIDSGSVGDAAHFAEQHGYHVSYADQAHDDGYSVHYWGDKHFPGKQGPAQNYACALDVSLPSPLMVKYTGRLHRLAVQKSPLVWGLREFAGTVNTRDVFAWDLTSHNRTYGWDDSHLWHIHLSFNRRFILNPHLLVIAEAFK